MTAGGRSRALSLYHAAASLAEPAVVRWLRFRAGRSTARERERLGERFLPRPAGPLVWLHGVSVGESLSLLPLVAELGALRPELALLVTSRTRSSATLLEQRLPPGVLRSYAPLDLPGCVDRFLRAWRPDVLVLVESELWPGVTQACHRAGLPVALINARMSDRSLRNWRRFPDAARSLLAPVRLAETGDPVMADRLRELGASPAAVRVTGSLKAAGRPLPADPAEVERVRQVLAGRFAWLAASTHEADERVVLAAQQRILRHHPDAVLVVVPRHPERGGALAREAQSRGLPALCRSEGASLPGAGPVYIADTLGELGLWYRGLPVAFIGGSFGGIGGHNPYEPAALGTAILHGPDIANFGGIYRDLDAEGGACPVAGADGLGAALLDRLDATGAPGPAVAGMVARAREIAAPQEGEARRLALRLLQLVDRRGGGG